MAGLGWVDVFMLAVLLLSVLLGLLRGLVQEVMSVLGWLVAWLCAQAWGAPSTLALEWLPGGPAARHAVGFILCFVVVLFAWRILTWLIGKVMQATPLAPVDRVLGAIFGALRAGLIVVVLVTLAAYTPVARQSFWGESRAVMGAHWLLDALAPTMPASWTVPPPTGSAR